MAETPLYGEALLAAAATASVPGERVAPLAARVQADVGSRVGEYRRTYECVHESDEALVFLVPTEHWAAVGDRLALSRREWEAVRRAHNEHLGHLGHRTDRTDEFETALEIRDAVVVGRDGE